MNYSIKEVWKDIVENFYLTPEETGVKSFNIFICSTLPNTKYDPPTVKLKRSIEGYSKFSSLLIDVSDLPLFQNGNSLKVRREEYENIRDWIILNKEMLCKIWYRGLPDNYKEEALKNLLKKL